MNLFELDCSLTLHNLLKILNFNFLTGDKVMSDMMLYLAHVRLMSFK